MLDACQDGPALESQFLPTDFLELRACREHQKYYKSYTATSQVFLFNRR